MDLSNYLNRRTLILGDVNAGKTIFCKTILDEMQRQGLSPRIVIIDLAPDISEAGRVLSGMQGVGGKLLAIDRGKVVSLTDSFAPPRLSSKDEQEALQKARQNAAKCLSLFKQCGQLQRDILFINDISIFLQTESAELVMELIASVKTVVANGYFGEKLGAGSLSLHERREMESLKGYFDKVILL